MKPIKKSIAYLIYNTDRSRFVTVQRPKDDEDLPNMWGLPAGSLKEGETEEQAVVRSGRQKLGVELKIVRKLCEGQLERKNYTLQLADYEAVITSGEPQAPQQVPGVTQYQAWRWGTSDDIKEIASKGSLCAQLYLKHVADKSLDEKIIRYTKEFIEEHREDLQKLAKND